MKKIVFLLCLGYGSVQAQQMTIAAGGGLAIAGLSGNGAKYDPVVSTSGMLSAALRVKSYQLGIRADIFNIRTQVTQIDSFFNERRENVDFFKPSIGISAFTGKVFHHALIDVSVSLTAGVVFNKSAAVWGPEKNMKGFSAGLDIGITHYFTKRLGVFINASPRYLFQDISAYALPLNVGLSTKL